MDGRKQPVPEDVALASDIFDQFCNASTLKAILGLHRHLCEVLRIKPTNFPHFYPKLKAKLRSWKAQALWTKFDKRASHKCYNRGKVCANTRVLIIGAGPCGLRTAIEAQLLGAKVVVVEKRDRISRHNVLHLWPFVIHDLRALGAKKFFGKFCAGAIDHISIRQLQFILLKVALILGVEIHEGVGFESLIPPPEDQTNEKIGWRARIDPPDHPVSQYEFDVLIGADGKRNTLDGFKRKEFRGKLAIAITANFINHHTEAEARVEEISGVAFIFNQKFFKDLNAETGIDLENIVYYKDETHYFVMTAKKHSLIDKGVIIQDYSDTAKLLAPDNVDKDALKNYAREAADFSTGYQLPQLEFAVNHYGQPDVAMFDFTSMFAAENASRVVERHGHKLLQILVGDSLLEPFWPTGSGCARGFLSSLDACWAVKSWGSGHTTVLEVLAERESVYRLLAQTTPENLQRDYNAYTLDPHTRYTNLNIRAVMPIQVRSYFDTDNTLAIEQPLVSAPHELSKKRRRKDSQVHPDTLLHWLKKQVALYDTVRVEDMTTSFKNGLVLCAIIHRYRPDLVDFHSLKAEDIAANNQLAFDVLERELGIPPVMTGQEMEQCDVPDKLTMLSYLSQIYDTFRGEIPHIKHPKLEENDLHQEGKKVPFKPGLFRTISKEQTVSLLTRLAVQQQQQPRTSTGRKRQSVEREPVTPAANQSSAVDKKLESLRRQRKRRSVDKDKLTASQLERQKIVEEIERNREERMMRRRFQRHLATQQFYKSMQMLEANIRPAEPTTFEDYDIFVYRQTAPAFEDRVKDMEKKILYPDREARIRAEIQEIRKSCGADEDFSEKIKMLEEKRKGYPVGEKKPKDLMRAIGKIEKTDWNVKEIEKKIMENKMGGRMKQDRSQKVPKWSKQQFEDKFQAVQLKLLKKDSDFTPLDRYADYDVTLKHFDKKIKDGNVLEMGIRGNNKVSAMAEQFAFKNQEPEKPAIQKSSSKGSVFLPKQSSSELCHFCSKRVYLMERMSAEGKFFHRGCFRCEYCNTSLRLGNYAYDRDGKFGNKFFCIQHFGLRESHRLKARRKSEEIKAVVDKENIPTDILQKSIVKASSLHDTPVRLMSSDAIDAQTTPERIEFENLTAGTSDVEETPGEMDEDEWTDRNFGASAAEISSDSSSDLSDSDEDEEVANEVFEEAIDQPVPVTVDATRRLAESWSRHYSKSRSVEPHDKNTSNKTEEHKNKDTTEEDEDSESFEYEDSNDEYSYHEYDTGDDESETATEGDDDIQARELRKQEVRLEVPRIICNKNSDTGSDTEIASDEYTSTESDSEEEGEEKEILNSATEIETDSEFEHDGTTPVLDIPTIFIDDSNITKHKHHVTEEPKKVQVRTGHILQPINGRLGRSNTKPNPYHINQDDVKKNTSPLKHDEKKSNFSILTASNNFINAHMKKPVNNTPTPLINPRKGDYLLNRTHSTEGIASKLSLELKKKYLLGASGLSGSVKKSGSATTLDSKFKSFVDMISEQQKLLHPAPEPSPTMQAFLQGTAKLTAINNNMSALPTSPTALSPPLKLPPSPSQQTSLALRKQKELPYADSAYEHICQLRNKNESTLNSSNTDHSLKPQCDNIISSNSHTKENGVTCDKKNYVDNVNKINSGLPERADNTNFDIADNKLVDNKIESHNERDKIVKENGTSPDKNLKEGEEEADCRPRSPVHETSIVVPEVTWNTADQDEEEEEEDDDVDIDVEIDSLSDDSLSDIDENIDKKEELTSPLKERTPPRVEIHNSCGELLVEYGTACVETTETNNSTSGIKPSEISVHLSLNLSKIEDGKEISKIVHVPSREHKVSVTISDRSSPTTPPSLREDSESYQNELTLADTELSDWAHDGDAVVSEDLEDIEYNINPETVRNRKSKSVRKGGRVLESKSDRIINVSDNYPGHICGRHKRGNSELGDITAEVTSNLLTRMDSIEFMDTGEEDENSETQEILAATNNTLIKNRGYVQFVNSFDDDDLSTPVAETQNVILDFNQSSMQKVNDTNVKKKSFNSDTTNTKNDTIFEVVNKEILSLSAEDDLQLEGTTTEDTASEVTTIKDTEVSAAESNKEKDDIFYTPQPCTLHAPTASPEESVGTEEATNKAYEEYVKRLQGRISPFSNARDSIDVRKSQRKSRPKIHKEEEIPEEHSTSPHITQPSQLSGYNSPNTSRKLEEISRERSKQKNLIHEMVMNKFMDKSPHERKSRKSRSSLSPDTDACQKVHKIESWSNNQCETSADTISNKDSPKGIFNNLEVPFVDNSPVDETDRYFTPPSSFKKPETLVRNRPVSVYASFKSESESAAEKQHVLPDTPLTKPDAFLLPDIRKTLFKSEGNLNTPVAPPRSKHDAVKQLFENLNNKEEVCHRRRREAGQDVGHKSQVQQASPDSQTKSNKHQKLTRCLSEPNEVDKKELPENMLKKSATQSLQEEEKTKTFFKENVENLASDTSCEAASSPSPTSKESKDSSKTKFYLSPDATSMDELNQTNKKLKDRDRRKSIIQAVSDFFHKKKDTSSSPSPPKTPVGSSGQKEKFSKFKFSRNRGKSPHSSESEESDEKNVSKETPLSKQEEKLKSITETNHGNATYTPPPPIPPPPLQYQSRSSVSKMSEDSLSEAEDDSRATALSVSLRDDHGTGTSRRQSRVNRRLARQAQMKRLRMAQEIQRQLEEVEVKQRELEQRGVSVEKALRGERQDNSEHEDEGELLKEWFDLMRERSELRRYERELMVRAQEMELEDRHAQLQQELRDRMSLDDSSKTREDVEKEGQILKEMLEIVEKRDSLCLLLEEDRQRYQEEDRDFEAQMLAKGLRLTPLRKEAND